VYTNFVYIGDMIKNITFTADETLIHLARKRAMVENTTLNDLFRRWLDQYVAQSASVNRYEDVMNQLSYIRSGRKLSREEMNERG
jgi:hypothetical protein